MAMLITAGDHIDRLRAFGTVLRQRGLITEPAYRDHRDSLDYIAHANLIARRNTARLRNETRP